MRHLLATLTICILTPLMAFGQSRETTITGSVQDSASQVLAGATTVLLRAQDSVLVAFTIAGKGGYFSLPNIPAGQYLLQITYVGYGSFQRIVQVDGTQSSLDLGKINLGGSVINLEEVTVREEFVPILIKKDTIEYNAGAYKTTPNATVEDLLKQMPGIEVEQDGTVKAQGEEVKQVLVDGKEFFGKDPKVATKNLPADAVDKVQVFDKKSEEAEFTGIDDGKEEKTINLKLKEDKKKGVFGNVEAAYGPPDLYRGKLNVNRFGKGIQITALGLGNNLNEQGFSFGDYMDFMGGGVTFEGRPGRFTLGSVGIPLSFNGDEGTGNAYAGGVNFNLDIGKKTKFQSFYFYNNVHHILEKEVSRTNILQDGTFETHATENSITDNTGHRIQGKLEHEFDSTQSIIFSGYLGFGNTQLAQDGTDKTFIQNMLLQNKSYQEYNSDGSSTTWNNSLIYRKRFKKKGRSLTLRGNMGGDLSDGEGTIYSIANFYNDQGATLSSDTTNQRQVENNDNPNYELSITYTEPLSKDHFIQLAGSRHNYLKENQKSFYDLTPAPKINDDLSSHFKQIYTADAWGIRYRIDEEKLRLNIGTEFQHSQLRGEILNRDTTIARAYNYLLPSIWGEYSFESTRSLSMYYFTSTNEPSLDQLQPVVTNNDPLKIYEGNPYLQPEYEHHMSLRYRAIDQFNFRNLFALLSFRYRINPIVKVTTVDSLLRQIISYSNADKSWSASDYLSYGIPIKPLKISIQISQDADYSHSPYFLNESQDQATSFYNTLRLRISNRKKEKIDASAGVSWNYTNIKYEVNEQLNQSYQNYSLSADLQVNFPLSITLKSGFDRKTYSHEAFGKATVLSMWDAELSKGFWDNRLTIKGSVKDILNQNIGLERNAEQNYIEEVHTNTLGRYFLISLTYKLSKVGGERRGGVFIERD